MSEFTDYYKSLMSLVYYSKGNAGKEIEAYSGQFENLKKTMDKFIDQLDLDKAQGWSLDVIGKIVGYPRVVPNIVPKEYFGYEGAPAAQPYSGSGSYFDPVYDSILADTQLTDTQYRPFLRTKIAKNSASSYLISDSKISIQNAIIESSLGGAYIAENFGMSCKVYYNNTIDPLFLAIMKKSELLPRPMGVSYEFIFEQMIQQKVQGVPSIDVSGFTISSTPEVYDNDSGLKLTDGIEYKYNAGINILTNSEFYQSGKMLNLKFDGIESEKIGPTHLIQGTQLVYDFKNLSSMVGSSLISSIPAFYGTSSLNESNASYMPTKNQGANFFDNRVYFSSTSRLKSTCGIPISNRFFYSFKFSANSSGSSNDSLFEISGNGQPVIWAQREGTSSDVRLFYRDDSGALNSSVESITVCTNSDVSYSVSWDGSRLKTYVNDSISQDINIPSSSFNYNLNSIKFGKTDTSLSSMVCLFSGAQIYNQSKTSQQAEKISLTM